MFYLNRLIVFNSPRYAFKVCVFNLKLIICLSLCENVQTVHLNIHVLVNGLLLMY